MQRLLFALLLCSSFGLTSSSSTINSDLLAISSLSQDLRKYSPEVARRFLQTTCAMVTECCPQMQSKFASTALLGDSEDFTEQCFGGKQSSNALRNLLACPPLTQLATMGTDKDLLQYMSIILTNLVSDEEDKKLTLATCTEKELYSIACDWHQSEEQISCQRKMLEKWAAQGDQVYAKKVQETKDVYTKAISALQKNFRH